MAREAAGAATSRARGRCLWGFADLPPEMWRDPR